MTTLQYVGGSHVRTISAAEFKAAGVEGAKKLETVNMGKVEVSEAVSEYLLEAEAGHWKVVDPDPVVEAPVAEQASVDVFDDSLDQ